MTSQNVMTLAQAHQAFTHLQSNWDQIARSANDSARPVYLDATGILVLECRTKSHHTLAWVYQQKIKDYLNEQLPDPGQITGVFPTMRPIRVLVTGSRTWDAPQVIADALLDTWHDVLQAEGPEHPLFIVHGNCPRGADAIAHEWALSQDGGLIIPRPYRADWDRYGRRAGIMRNHAMVDDGADVCLAFIKDESRGASHCADRAEAEGIPTRRFVA